VTELVAFFLVLALSAYVVFGGADFGGGVLEATLPSRALKKKLQAALAPVWEANHVWLIAVLVIAFVGFPRLYSFALTRLYVPVSLALLAILVRGTFFTLRKYDPDPGRSRALYNALFRVSSFAAPFCFGFILSGLLATHPGSPTQIPHTLGFYDIYIAPWFGAFGLVSGLFIASLFAYAAAVFFYGERLTDEERALVQRRILQFFALTFVLGGAVLVLGAVSGRVDVAHAFHPVQLLSQLGAAVSVVVLFWALRRGRIWLMRLSVGAQILSILLGWYSAHYPDLMYTAGGNLTLDSAAAPFVTQLWLVIGLVVVLAAVVPLLVLLYRVFDAT
jgi:cytochrome d ubiquinol oxidase subunit II